MKIGIVIPYFGRMPSYADLFFWSAARNPNLEYLLFTDAANVGAAPDNVKVIPFTLAAFNELARRKTGLAVAVEPRFAYKLCDLKPLYGAIFEEYLTGYDFFGFGDLDVILGDTRSFFTPELLAAHDVVSNREAYLSGSMALLRNTPALRFLYRESSDHKRILEDASTYHGFDEVGHQLMRYLKNWSDLLTMPRQIESFSHLLAERKQDGRLRVAFADRICEAVPRGTVLKLAGGHVTAVAPDEGKEYAYFHFVNEKQFFHFRFHQAPAPEARLFVTAEGFYTDELYRLRGVVGPWRRLMGLARKYLVHYPKRAMVKLR